MTQLRDPYGVLGLRRGASQDDIKRAYRRLAKQHHPDATGGRTLARFLEIQAAYEQLVHGPGSGATSAGGAARPSWQADPTRADATRRAYGRARRTGTRPPSAGGGTPRERPPQEPPDQEPPREPRRRGPRKATLGSTSYDEAVDQPFDPDWSGSSWYGTTSGTYWTLNPREYADPRKHGPEYQARARRKAAGGPEFEAADPGEAEEPREPERDRHATRERHREPPGRPVSRPGIEQAADAGQAGHARTIGWRRSGVRGSATLFAGRCACGAGPGRCRPLGPCRRLGSRAPSRAGRRHGLRLLGVGAGRVGRLAGLLGFDRIGRYELRYA